MKMRTILFAGACVLALTAPVRADYDSGMTAYEAQDYGRALTRFQTAADMGDARAQHMLGLMYAEGLGVPQDYLRAHIWLNLAAAGGADKAAEARGKVENRMTLDQVGMAQQSAAEWEPVGAAATAARPAFSVRAAQQMLNRLGYEAGPESGIMGRRTRTAILAFQEDEEVAANGRLDAELFDRLVEKAGRDDGPARPARTETETQPKAQAQASPSASAAAAAPAQPAPTDARARLVSDVQARLRRLDYDPGPVDGSLNERTRTAIRSFQADVDMPVTGEATQALAQRLAAYEANEKGTRRETIRQAQTALNALGYDAGRPDGAIGPSTRAAVRAFQEKSNLTVTGEVDSDLVASLDKAVAEQRKAEAEAGKAQEAAAAPPPRDLVLALEQELNRRGYDAGVEDGVMDEATAAGIRAFQMDKGLEVTGEASEALLANVRAADTEKADELTPATVADLERELDSRGYPVGAVDGRVDGQLRAAIRLFQSDAGMEQTGEPSAALLADIRASDVTRKTPTTGQMIEGLTGTILKGLSKEGRKAAE